MQNREVPTGSVEVHLTSGDEKVLVVSDVNPVLEELETAGVKTIVRDVPGDNIFLTSILPALITVGGGRSVLGNRSLRNMNMKIILFKYVGIDLIPLADRTDIAQASHSGFLHHIA